MTSLTDLHLKVEVAEDAVFDDVASEADIYECFRLLLGRLPARRELQEHSFRAGQPLNDVVRSFLNSPEHSARNLREAGDYGTKIAELTGFRMFVMPEDAVLGREICETGDYETNVSGVFRRMLKPGMRVLDIGANVGFYSLLSASLIGEEGRVWALEPSPRNAAFLLASLQLNGFKNVELIQAAASYKWEVLSFFADSTNGVTETRVASDPASLGQTVQALPASAIVPAGERMDIVKMDIEGAEGKALLGIFDLLKEHKPAVFAEFSPTNMPARSGMTGEEFLDLFYLLGYKLALLEPSGVVDCGTDPAKVMAGFEKAQQYHVDLLATPVGE